MGRCDCAVPSPRGQRVARRAGCWQRPLWPWGPLNPHSWRNGPINLWVWGQRLGVLRRLRSCVSVCPRTPLPSHSCLPGEELRLRMFWNPLPSSIHTPLPVQARASCFQKAKDWTLAWTKGAAPGGGTVRAESPREDRDSALAWNPQRCRRWRVGWAAGSGWQRGSVRPWLLGQPRVGLAEGSRLVDSPPGKPAHADQPP